MKARIKDKKEVADGTLMVQFELLSEQPNFKAGQYFFVTLPNLHYSDNRGAKRHFSIVNSPNEKGVLTMATRIREESGFKKTLKELPLGAEAEVGPIAGNFTLPEDTMRPLVFIAGGIGITPFMSMLKFVEEEKLPFKIILIYSNRNRLSTPFFNQLQMMADQNANLRLILTMTEDPNWTGEKRRIDSQFIKYHTKDLQKPLFFVVGPPPMVEGVVSVLKEAGVTEENIKQENFSGY